MVIGAQGEVLMGVGCLTPRMRILRPDGLEHGATVLGFDRALGVAVARLDPGTSAPLVPPKVDLEAQLSPERWLVVLTHDRGGRPTSHAGQVSSRSSGGPRVGVEVPGQVGSPVFSAQGGLVGISVTQGRRRVMVQPVASLVQFLERVVMGGSLER